MPLWVLSKWWISSKPSLVLNGSTSKYLHLLTQKEECLFYMAVTQELFMCSLDHL